MAAAGILLEHARDPVAGAGAAGLLKAVYAVHEKVLPPTLNAETPNPGIDFASSPFFLNHELREWTRTNGAPRSRANAASASVSLGKHEPP